MSYEEHKRFIRDRESKPIDIERPVPFDQLEARIMADVLHARV